jgi:hypothetical protein
MASVLNSSPTRVVLTVDDVRQWKAGLLAATAQITELLAIRDDLERKLAAAAMFVDVDAVEAEDLGSVADDSDESLKQIAKISEGPASVALPMALPPKRRRSRTGETWSDVVLEGVSAADLGLTYAEMRDFASESSLGKKLEQSDKGYHNAIGRLARSGEIVRQHGRLFTPDAYKRFLEAVDRGEATTTVAQPMAYSPMGEAILNIVAAHPGELNGKLVITELRRDPEHNATLTPHETGAYNIIARLVRRKHLARRDDGTLLPGPSFPRNAEEQQEEPPV